VLCKLTGKARSSLILLIPYQLPLCLLGHELNKDFIRTFKATVHGLNDFSDNSSHQSQSNVAHQFLIARRYSSNSPNQPCGFCMKRVPAHPCPLLFAGNSCMHQPIMIIWLPLQLAHGQGREILVRCQLHQVG
jgi:hypothetical protein